MMGRTCAVHHHREDVPLEVHHVWPRGDGGPDKPANRVTLCANGHGSVHALMDLMRKGPVPWSIRRRYGRRVRRETTYTTRVRASGVEFLRRKLGVAQTTLVTVDELA